MIKRPSPGDTEEDIIQMQADFLREQYKNENFQPAAKVVKQNPPSEFLVRQKIHFILFLHIGEFLAARKVSKFAERRAQEKLEKGCPSASNPDGPKSDTNLYRPIIGDIRERRTEDGLIASARHSTESAQGFPIPERLNRSQVEYGLIYVQNLFGIFVWFSAQRISWKESVRDVS